MEKVTINVGEKRYALISDGEKARKCSECVFDKLSWCGGLCDAMPVMMGGSGDYHFVESKDSSGGDETSLNLPDVFLTVYDKRYLLAQDEGPLCECCAFKSLGWCDVICKAVASVVKETDKYHFEEENDNDNFKTE